MSLYSEHPEGGTLPVEWDSDDGPEITLLWECDLSVVAKRANDFVEFDLEDPDDVVVLAHSEQGLLAYVFFYLVEDLGGGAALTTPGNTGYRELEELSTALGFRHLDEVVRLQTESGAAPDCDEKVLNFTRSL